MYSIGDGPQILRQEEHVAAICQIDVGVSKDSFSGIKFGVEVLGDHLITGAGNGLKVFFLGNVFVVSKAKEVHDAGKSDSLIAQIYRHTSETRSIFVGLLIRDTKQIYNDAPVNQILFDRRILTDHCTQVRRR